MTLDNQNTIKTTANNSDNNTKNQKGFFSNIIDEATPLITEFSNEVVVIIIGTLAHASYVCLQCYVSGAIKNYFGANPVPGANNNLANVASVVAAGATVNAVTKIVQQVCLQANPINTASNDISNLFTNYANSIVQPINNFIATDKVARVLLGMQELDDQNNSGI